MRFLHEVRQQNPLVHNITNIVVAGFSANGLLALGASPFMADAPEEVADIAAMAGAVVLNIGTLNEAAIDSMILAGRAANRHSTALVLDPVGAGATPYRNRVTERLLSEMKLTALRGNASEVAHIAGVDWGGKGVDAGDGSGDVVEIAETAARKLDCIVVLTGESDVVTDGNRTYICSNGHPILTRVTGTGCLLSAVVGAFLAVAGDHKLEAAAEAVSFYGVAAEMAAGRAGIPGPGSFAAEFLNRLSSLDADTAAARSRIALAKGGE